MENIGKLFIDFEAWKRDQIWYSYAEKMLYLVEVLGNSVEEAHKHLIDKYPEYRIFK